MSVSALLFIILFVAMALVGGKRGIKSFFILVGNFVIIFFALILFALGIDPVKTTVVVCVIISSITLFYSNGFNRKTVASFISVIIAVLLTMAVTYGIGINARIQGLSAEEAEGISFLTLSVPLDFTKIFICQVMIGLLGAIIDVSITVSSSMKEILGNNRSITKYGLYKSGLNIGKDILGTMTNTLLFAYIGSFMTLIIYFYCQKYSIADIINRKAFCSEVFQIICSGLGVILIIPLTSLVSSLLFFKAFRKIPEQNDLP